jgi:hypothetical protein
MTLRRVISLLCLTVCTVALVGCGGDTFALDPVASAADKTASSYSSRFTFTAEVTGMAGNFSMAGNGIFDGRAKTGWMNMTMKVPPQMQSQLGSNPSIELIMDGSDGLVMYMRSSAFAGLPSNKWLKFDVEKLADKGGVDLDAFMNTNRGDPSQVLAMLKASSQARVTGFEKVRGVRTTKYALRIDLSKLGEDAGFGEQFQQALDMTGVKSFPAEAWVDSQERIRRLKLTWSMGNQFGMTITEEFFDFGVRANIFPPAESDVVDLSAMIGG